MPEQKYNRDTNRFEDGGLDLNRPLDSIKPNKYPYLQNVRAYQQGRIEPREGLQAIDSALDSASVHSIRRLNDPVNSSYTRIVGTGSLLGFGQTHFAAADTGYSGDPLALVPYRPEASPQSWMYVADRSRMRKIDRTGTLHTIGLPWPMTPPQLATLASRLIDISVPQYKVIDDFDATTGWAGAGTAGAPSLLSAGPGYRTTSTISQILYDNGTTGWASVALVSMAGVGVGEDLTFNPGGGSAENAIVEAMYGNAANVTIGSIIYDSGTSGLCSISVSSTVSATGFAGVVSPGILLRNTTTSENFRVLAVTSQQDENIAIRAYTSGTFTAGDTIQILSSFRVYLANNHSTGETVRTDGIRSAITAGTGTLTKTAALDLSLIASGLPSHPEDYMHISIRVSDAATVTQIRVMLDVDSTTNDFAHNYFAYTVKATDLTVANIWQPITSVKDIQPAGLQTVPINVQLVSGQVVSANLNFPNHVVSTTGTYLGDAVDKITISGQLYTNAVVLGNTLIGRIVQATGAGLSQWTEIRFRLSDLDRFGTDYTRTLANVATIRIEIKATASLNLDLDSWWIGGGYGPDSGATTAVPYLYRYRARVPSTGVRSNWSPALRGGLTPKRQAIVVRLPQYPVPSGTTLQLSDIVLDVQRYGGEITEWHYVGTANNSDSVPNITDIYPDDTVSKLPAEGQDFWQPWPIIGLPVSGPASGTSTAAGTTLNDGATGFNTSWAPGTQIFINGIPFTIYRVISTSRLETVENMGTIASVTWKVPEPTILAQPLPCLWGDDQLGVMFACGDTTNPGRLYYSNPNDPDTTKESNYRDITSSSEMLMNGVVYNGRAYQFSSERYFELLPDGQGGWRAIEVPGGRGLYARWAITRNPTPMVCFLAKDGIYSMVGGAAESLTDADLYPLFPHEGNEGVSVNGVLAPVVSGAGSNLRIEVYDDYLYLDYVAGVSILTTCPLTGGTLGVAYSLTLEASGGTPAYTWSIESGALPTGLSLSSSGVISGTPTATGTFNFTLKVTDAAASIARSPCGMTVTGQLASSACGQVQFSWSYNSLVGPFWRSGDPNEFFAVAKDDTNAKRMKAVGSTSSGSSGSWTVLDDTFPTLANNIGSFECRQSGSNVVVVTQEVTTGRVAYSRFDLITQAWIVQNAQVIASNTQGDLGVSIDVRLSGNVVIAYQTNEENVGGTNYARIGVRESSNDGSTWSSEFAMGDIGVATHNGISRTIASVVFNSVHIFFSRSGGVTTPACSQTLSTSNTISAVVHWGDPAFTPASICGKPVAYSVSGSGKIAVPYKDGGPLKVSVFADNATVLSATPESTAQVNGSPEVAQDITTCNYPAATLDYAGTSLGVVSWRSDTNPSYIYVETGGNTAWTPTAANGRISPTTGSILTTTQHANGIVLSLNGVLYAATFWGISTTINGFQLMLVAALPATNQTQAAWQGACP